MVRVFTESDFGDDFDDEDDTTIPNASITPVTPPPPSNVNNTFSDNNPPMTKLALNPSSSESGPSVPPVAVSLATAGESEKEMNPFLAPSALPPRPAHPHFHLATPVEVPKFVQNSNSPSRQTQMLENVEFGSLDCEASDNPANPGPAGSKNEPSDNQKHQPASRQNDNSKEEEEDFELSEIAGNVKLNQLTCPQCHSSNVRSRGDFCFDCGWERTRTRDRDNNPDNTRQLNANIQQNENGGKNPISEYSQNQNQNQSQKENDENLIPAKMKIVHSEDSFDHLDDELGGYSPAPQPNSPDKPLIVMSPLPLNNITQNTSSPHELYEGSENIRANRPDNHEEDEAEELMEVRDRNPHHPDDNVIHQDSSDSSLSLSEGAEGERGEQGDDDEGLYTSQDHDPNTDVHGEKRIPAGLLFKWDATQLYHSDDPSVDSSSDSDPLSSEDEEEEEGARKRERLLMTPEKRREQRRLIEQEIRHIVDLGMCDLTSYRVIKAIRVIISSLTSS